MRRKLGRKQRKAVRRAAITRRGRSKTAATTTAEGMALQLRRIVRVATRQINRRLNANPNGVLAADILAAFGKDDATALQTYLASGEALSTPKPAAAAPVVTPAIAPV
jgi:hypothetical protein